MLRPGQQILYVPSHANGDASHKDVEAGFIAKKSNFGDAFFCRYWIRGKEGEELRTTANSELTNSRDLVEKDSCDQELVESAMITLGYRYEY